MHCFPTRVFIDRENRENRESPYLQGFSASRF